MKPIHLFVPKYEISMCLEEIKDAMESGWTGLGGKTNDIEHDWKEYTGLNHAHFVNSATSGLHLAVRILKEKLGWRQGDEVISTPITFVSSNHALLYEGLQPRFADVDDFLCLDPKAVEASITPRTRAVMFVGHGGSTGQWRKIVDLCRARGLSLILDAAHQAGTTLDGRCPGVDADAVVYSFHSVKNLPTADSGMICFADESMDEAARRLSWLGIDRSTFLRTFSDGRYRWRYGVEEVGYKYHGNSIMAAIALAQLKVLERDNDIRRAISARYDEAFARHPVIQPIPQPKGCRSSRHLYQIRLQRRDDAIEYLNERQIYPGVHYLDNRQYGVYSGFDGPCPNAERASDELLSLPLHLNLDESDVERVIAALLDFSA